MTAKTRRTAWLLELGRRTHHSSRPWMPALMGGLAGTAGAVLLIALDSSFPSGSEDLELAIVTALVGLMLITGLAHWALAGYAHRQWHQDNDMSSMATPTSTPRQIEARERLG